MDAPECDMPSPAASFDLIEHIGSRREGAVTVMDVGQCWHEQRWQG
jgi:hypothetical protein